MEWNGPLEVAQFWMLSSSLKGWAKTSEEGVFNQRSSSWSTLVPLLVLHQSINNFGEL